MSPDPDSPHRVDGDLGRQLGEIHALIRSRYDFVDRVALALYDPGTDLLKTFVSSNADEVALVGYQIELARVPSLAELAAQRRHRVVDDIALQFGSASTHSAWLHDRGYRASYTVPVFDGATLAAFLFFDSKRAACFTPEVATFLDGFSDIVAQLYLLRRRLVDGIIGTVQVAVGLAKVRDLETGEHLERIAHYSRLMARALAPRHGLGDEYVEYVYLFAPLHDIGKVGIPDRILQKPDTLDAQEWAVMRTHVAIGERIIATIAAEVDLGDSMALRIMRNIVAAHHERCDGSGYPRGLRGDDIALEARIVAVADVFDALTNRRPYKQPWSDSAVWREMFAEAAAQRLDGECVDALFAAQDALRLIRTRFAEPD